MTEQPLGDGTILAESCSWIFTSAPIDIYYLFGEDRQYPPPAYFRLEIPPPLDRSCGLRSKFYQDRQAYRIIV